MSRRDGNREEVLAEIKLLIIQFRDDEVTEEDFRAQLIEICQEHKWLVEPDRSTITPLEWVRAEVMEGSPRPHGVVPFGLKFTIT